MVLVPALAQEPPTETAEQIIARLSTQNNTEGLAVYAQKLVEAARSKNEIIQAQRDLIAKMEEDRKQLYDALAGVKVSIKEQQDITAQQFVNLAQQSEGLKIQLDKERAEREKLLTMVSNLNKKGWRSFMSTGAQGATIGAATGQNWQGGTVGLGLGLLIELIRK